MTDNFEKIRSLLDFSEPGDFYFLELLLRKKDGLNVPNGQHNASRLVKDYYITSRDRLDDIRGDVISKCNETGARAYIRLNKRNFRTVSLAFAEEMLARVRTGESFNDPRVAISSVVGRFHSAGKNKTWIVDIDDATDDDEKVKSVAAAIDQCEPIGVEKIVARIPTRSGVHLISRPFNASKFVEIVRGVDIHKDNPTVLYCP